MAKFPRPLPLTYGMRKFEINMQTLLELVHEEPIGSFAILLAVILIVPILFERVRLPGPVGLLAAGIALGPHGLNLLQSDTQIMTLLADIGLLYLMFVAGLEIDSEQFSKIKHRALGFGSLTFLFPLTAGTLIGRIFQFDWNASVLIGSLLASHSLMTYPILRRLGVVNNEAVTVTLGGTIFTDIGALIILAICLGVGTGKFTAFKLFILLGSLTIYTLVILLGFDRVGREFLRRSGTDEGNQFLFLLLAVFLAALGAELIGVEKIVGAFLTGLAVNDAVGEGPVKEKVVFVGSVLFIPIFFVNIGLLLDLPAFVRSLSSFSFTASIIGGLLAGKFAAAFCTKLLYRYRWREMLTMWSMSLPQVATTLAATLVGQRAGLLSDEVLNSVVVMMLVTATLGPILVSRVARGLPLPVPEVSTPDTALAVATPERNQPFTVVVPVYNPKTEQYLIELAALLARHQGGQIVPLAITVARPHMDAMHLKTAIARSEELLELAIAIGNSFNVRTRSLLRIDDRVARGISWAAQEQKASLIVMGWGKRTGLRARLFGNIIDSVFWAAHCPVAVARLLMPPGEIKRILIPVENFSAWVVRRLELAEILAATNQAQITLLHVRSHLLLEADKVRMRSQMTALAAHLSPTLAVETAILPSDNIVKAIAHESQQYDLVVLHAQPTQSSAEGLGGDDLASQILAQISCSAIVLNR